VQSASVLEESLQQPRSSRNDVEARRHRQRLYTSRRLCSVFTWRYDGATLGRVSTTQRREKLYNIRLSEDEDARFKLVAERHNLNVSSMLRMLVAGAARDSGAPKSAADLAASEWATAQASFLQTGVAGTLGRVLVARDHVRTTLATLDRTIGWAKESGEADATTSLDRFRAAVAAFPRLHNKERVAHVREFIVLIVAYADASQKMFAWVARRAGV
jgi:hypothetical protein